VSLFAFQAANVGDAPLGSHAFPWILPGISSQKVIKALPHEAFYAVRLPVDKRLYSCDIIISRFY
jgi:hypothetical protein